MRKFIVDRHARQRNPRVDGIQRGIARKSVHFAGSSQTFDVVYTPTDSTNVATALTETNVIVTGAGGCSAARPT